MKEKDFRETVEKISVPVHYFYAVPGSLFSPDLAWWYRDHIHAPYKTRAFQDSTHMLIKDNPELFIRTVIKALES